MRFSPRVDAVIRIPDSLRRIRKKQRQGGRNEDRALSENNCISRLCLVQLPDRREELALGR